MQRGDKRGKNDIKAEKREGISEEREKKGLCLYG